MVYILPPSGFCKGKIKSNSDLRFNIAETGQIKGKIYFLAAAFFW
jgi:hypothetical protein